MKPMMKIFTALTFTVPFMVIADTTYESCAKNAAPLAEFYHAKHIGMFDYHAKHLHDSSTRRLEELAQDFRSDKVYMMALKELVENDPEVAAEILDQKMKKKEKPFNVLSDFEKEHGELAYKKNGEGASVGWTGDRELEIELCKVQDHAIENLETEGKAVVVFGVRVCTYLTLVPKKMSSGGYRYVSRINDHYNIEPIPDRKVVDGDRVTLLRTVDQYKGFPIMPKDEFVAFQIEKTCGKDPKKAEYAMINFSERGNDKADLEKKKIQQQLINAGIIQ